MSEETWSVETISIEDEYDISGPLHRLADNTTAAIRLPDTYTEEEASAIVAEIGQHGVSWYPGFEHKQGRIGICATEYASKVDGKASYFALEEEASATREDIFPGNLDPIKRLFDVFSLGFDVAVALEPSLGNAKYFAGLIRAMGQQSTTHFDFAPQQLPGWRVADYQSQFAVIVYLQIPNIGGGLTVYNRQWDKNDEAFNKDTQEKGPEGFEPSFLEGEQSVTLSPNIGEMIVINSRNFHRVEQIFSKLARYSINSFMSMTESKLLIWN